MWQCFFVSSERELNTSGSTTYMIRPGKNYIIIIFFDIFWKFFDYVICEHTTKYFDSMFGLPTITIVLVGGTFLLILIALLYWGLTFKESLHD